MREVAPAQELIRFGPFEVDLRNRRVRKHGLKIRLQDQPFHILQILLEHPGELVTREELQRQIWPADTFVDFEKGLNNAIMKLRDACWLSLRNDSAAMKKQCDLVMGIAGNEDAMLSTQSDTEAFHGRLRQAREYSQLAADSARRNGTAEVAAGWVVNAALREAEFGNFAEARKLADTALQLSGSSRYIRAVAALALARAGDNLRAHEMQDALAKEFPEDTIVNAYWLPTVRAAIELNQHNSVKALELLRGAQGYELALPTPSGIAPLAVLYLRGYGLLTAGQNKDASAEFQRLLDRPGIVGNSPLGSLAHLGLGRSLAAAGEKEKARVAYQDFLTLWKDADPDIPILKQAKAEYAKLE